MTSNRVLVQENFSLKDYNTYRLDVTARYFALVHRADQLKPILTGSCFRDRQIMFLGGGSNVLFSGNFDGIVLKMAMKGKRVAKQTGQHVLLDVSAGEDWPGLVKYVVDKGWGGIENMALIPGTAGAAPIQNIAAYGHNLDETLVYVDVMDTQNGAIHRLCAAECRLGYRDSIFKHELQGRTVVLGIRLKLSKRPRLNISYSSRYESVASELDRIAEKPYTVSDVYQAICAIRRKKLPDAETVGTVGSVFKNPVITWKTYQELQRTCPGLHYYPVKRLSYDHLGEDGAEEPEKVKIPAAWLIENMGWSGKRIGQCGIWPSQPLNVVHYGNAAPSELLEFIHLIQEKVLQNYGVALEPEVVII
ncbi:MAG: UDP-N-acetylmuramate dehydrogenase [Desulfobacteraceae bacterium]|nr:UDP-N-acetylmuramate dehydrogenase [Desulfobacteraceae bacterium]